MAVDKLVDSTQLDANLTSVANAIRTKGGTSGSLAFPSGFISAVQAIPTGAVPTGTKQISITQNGTTTEDVAAYANAEITVNVQGGGGVQRVTGTFTPAETHSTNYSYPITTVEALGFTPKVFILSVKDAQDVFGVQYALLQNSYTECGDTPTYQRTMSRYSNTTGGKSGATNQTSWTTNAQSYLYLNNGTIYFNVSPTCVLVGNVDYVWAAYSA